MYSWCLVFGEDPCTEKSEYIRCSKLLLKSYYLIIAGNKCQSSIFPFTVSINKIQLTFKKVKYLILVLLWCLPDFCVMNLIPKQKDHLTSRSSAATEDQSNIQLVLTVTVNMT